MEQRRELCLLVFSRPFAHASQLLGHLVNPALRPGGARWSVFLLVEALGSTASAAFAHRSARGASVLFGSFPATTASSDFPGPFIGAVGSWTLAPRSESPPVPGSSGISQFPHAKCPCMQRVYDRAESLGLLPYRAPECCLPLHLTASAVRDSVFRGFHEKAVKMF